MRMLHHLLLQGLLSPGQVIQVLLAHIQSTPKLGGLALEMGVITMPQLLKALDAQFDTPELRLGQHMLLLGYCTQDELDHLLRAQRSRARDIPEIIEAQGHLSPGRLAWELHRLRAAA